MVCLGAAWHTRLSVIRYDLSGRLASDGRTKRPAELWSAKLTFAELRPVHQRFAKQTGNRRNRPAKKIPVSAQSGSQFLVPVRDANFRTGLEVAWRMSVDAAQLGAFLGAVIALVASPGPATLGLAAAGAAFGFRAARLFLAGLLCGAALTIFLVGSGVAGALLAHPIAAPILTGLAAFYMAYLAYRITTAAPLTEEAKKGRIPGFVPGFILAIGNPKAYAVFATLFSGFVVIPDHLAGNALLKGCVIMALLTAIDSSWLYLGSTLRHLFHDPKFSRRINIAFAVLLLVSVALALAV